MWHNTSQQTYCAARNAPPTPKIFMVKSYTKPTKEIREVGGRRDEVKWRRMERRKGKDIRRKEWECCLRWLPDSTAVPCVCVGCALNRCQLINPAALHSPQALSTVSATLHNHPTRGWEVQSWPVGRATLALGTRPPYTPLQRCPEHLGDENLTLSTLLPSLQHSCIFISERWWLLTWFCNLTLQWCTLLSPCCWLKPTPQWQACGRNWIRMCVLFIPSTTEGHSLNQSDVFPC